MKALNTNLIAIVAFVLTTQVIGFITVQLNHSNCMTIYSEFKSRYVPYTETYMERKWFVRRVKERLNYKIEWNKSISTVATCCDGYKLENKTCLPICTDPCVNGVCVSPDKCVCHRGYSPTIAAERQPFVCEPECTNNCPNGKCVRPEVCSCDQDYKALNDSECVPICVPECETGAKCTSPNLCTCEPGYWMAVANSTSCEPRCEQPCINSECEKPDVCRCKDGYEKDPKDPFLCSPKCEQDCQFGTCSAPNFCTCNAGYAAINESVCEPVCSEQCQNGRCIAPEICSCNDGYGLLGGSSYNCEPICEFGCSNGICFKPGQCLCYSGFQFKGTDKGSGPCEPICKVPCAPHGTCVAPDTCQCFDGYRVVHGDNEATSAVTSGCQPVCDDFCENGVCAEPNHCSCHDGYQQRNDSTYICEPICRDPCGPKSSCVAPDVCVCDPGYESIPNGSFIDCKPVCKFSCGTNGTCSAPDTCICDKNFIEDLEGRCVPYCDPRCLNGTCVAPYTCKCFEGFVAKNASVCEPFCEIGCENGKCVAPNECECTRGFRIRGNDSTCVPACARDCSDRGACVDEEEACECFFGWTGWNCNESTVCVVPLKFDDPKLDGIIVRNQTSTTLFVVQDYIPHCHSCNESLSNETLCYSVHSEDRLSDVACFFNAESPCYMISSNQRGVVTSNVVGPLVAVSILIIAGLAAVAYFLYRQHRKKQIHSAATQNALIQAHLANELLLSEEDDVCIDFN